MIYISDITTAKKAVTVAVIDSGINNGISDLNNFIKKATGFKVNEEGYIVEDEGLPVRNEHGTAIALVIKHICPNVEFLSFNILDETLRTDGRILLYAMEKAIEHKPDILHMSLGTTRWRYIPPMQRLIRKAMKAGSIVVAAAANNGKKSYPAYFRQVVGVKGIKSFDNKKFSYNNGFFYAIPFLFNIPSSEELTNDQMVGNSIAAAYITGHFAEIRSKYTINCK